MERQTYSRSLLSRRACDHCKKRKVKCNSQDPCANCQASALTCCYTAIQKKRGPPRGRRLTTRVTPADQHCSPVQSPIQNDSNESASLTAESTDDVGLSISFGDSSDAVVSPGPANNQFSAPSSLNERQTFDTANDAVLPGRLQGSSASAQHIRDGLFVYLCSVLSSDNVESFTLRCIDLFMQYVYPTIPIIHEATVRSYASTYFSRSAPNNLFVGESEDSIASKMSAFALITALCASVTAVMPPTLLQHGHLVATHLFRASREILQGYEEFDIEHPNSSSLSIRNLHCSAAEHITGKARLGTHITGQAILLVHALQLFDEESITRQTDPVEGQLLRLNFWHLYYSDKASVSLGTRPCLLHKTLFPRELTLHPKGFAPPALLDHRNQSYKDSFEEKVLALVGLLALVWSSGAALLQEMKLHVPARESKMLLVAKLRPDYHNFIGILDNLPSWLNISSLMSSKAGPNDYQVEAFWVQRCTLTMTFHCLRLMIMQQCVESDLVEIAGISEDPFSISMKKLEIIHDFVQAMEDIPFVYHQVKGEPSVERIRRVGTILLQMIQSVEHSSIVLRAKNYFERLLDTLTKLDSKASREFILL